MLMWTRQEMERMNRALRDGRCTVHVGDDEYMPCGEPAPYEVRRGSFGGGPDTMMACERHARDALLDGCVVDGLDELGSVG